MDCWRLLIILAISSRLDSNIQPDVEINMVNSPCNIERIRLSAKSTQKNLLDLPKVPKIYVFDEHRQASLTYLSQRDFLLSAYGKTTVKLTSSNSFSQGEVQMSLQDYIVKNVDVDASSNLANESMYLFGNNYDGIFSKLSQEYVVPPCKYCVTAGANSVGMGGKNSGVSYHYHGPGFSEVILGSKQWFLFPPHVRPVPGYDPNMTVKSWSDEIYPSLPPDSQLSECTIYPGEALYFPSDWMHATLNLDSYNVFVSVFLDPQLMHD